MTTVTEEQIHRLQTDESYALAVLQSITLREEKLARYEAALYEIAEGDMPRDWHPDNLAWWLRGVARKALRLPGWTSPPPAAGEDADA